MIIPIVVTLAGIVTVVRDEHKSKAEAPYNSNIVSKIFFQ